MVTQTNNANTGSDKLTITSLFVNDTRFQSMLAAAKPQIKAEIAQALEANIALLNIERTGKQRILDANHRFTKGQKSKMKKLRHHRAQLGFKKADKASRDVFSQQISEASSYKKTYERSVTNAQRDITDYDQKIAEFSRLLTA